MSWRGIKGAIEAAKQKHTVILTPNSHCYFDYYQSDNENEPLAIGGFLPLKKVYSFNPIPEELNADEAKYVLGAQGNLWTEYIPTPEKLEYMMFPRAIALAEVVWSKPDTKNYADFIIRLEQFNKRLDAMNVNYATHLYEVKGELTPKNGQLSYQLETTTKGKNIRYTTDNSNPNSSSSIYVNKIIIDKNTVIKAAVFDKKENQLGSIFEQQINFHKAIGKKITLSVPPHKSYNAGGKQALINGVYGNNKRYGDKEWLGFSGKDLEVTIDFDEPTEINKISTRFYNGNGQWIYAPKEVNLQLKSENGSIISSKNKVKNNGSLLVNFDLDLSQLYSKNEKTKSTSIKIIIPNYGIIEEGKQGEGHKAWTFIDEIVVE